MTDTTKPLRDALAEMLAIERITGAGIVRIADAEVLQRRGHALQNLSRLATPELLASLLARLDAAEADARRYRWLRDQHQGQTELDYDAEGLPMPIEPTAVAFTVFKPGRDLCLEPVGCLPGELDAFIDAALTKGA
jgi:hypothetical protein